MDRVSNIDAIKHINETVKLAGWVFSRRDHGKIIFIDLRDRSGLIQVVFSPQNEKVYKEAEKLRPEWVVEIKGKVNKRPEKMKNPNLETGEVEIETQELKILTQAKTVPFPIDNNGYDLDEDLRLKYRYLDLRRERMKKNIILRHKVIKFIRDFMSENSFIEIETPILTKATPEGARDFLVPSRLNQGKFYALPQSPQQYKQLLMVAGFEKYFQIAKCFRDEDLRGDRQPEFTQLDIEMSFATQEDILNVMEELFTQMVEKITDKKLTFKPFKRISYKEAMEKYGSDKPDLRENKNDPNELAFCWVLDWPLFEWNEDEKRWDACHHIFTAPKDEDISLLDKDPGKVRSWQHDLVLNGYELAGGSVRIHRPDIQEKILSLVGIKKEEARKKFGHLLEAFEYGVPPHGGIAPGIDRLLMILSGEPNIREVMAFPTTGKGISAVMEAPTEVDEKQLKELGIKLAK